MSPAPAAPKEPFSVFIDHTSRQFVAHKNTPEYALDLGIAPDELLAIARGEEVLSGLVSRSPWALGRIAALVRAKRDPISLGARLLAATHTDPYAWGMKKTGDRNRDLAYLLNLLD